MTPPAGDPADAALSPSTVFGLTVRNGASHLAEAIESLLAQTRADLGIVVVDDCSSDGSPEIVERYAGSDRRIVLERNDHRLGLVRNWRRAFDLAAERFPGAAYFAWASDHDVWHPSWLGELAAELEAHPEAVLAYPLAARIDDRGAEYPTRVRRAAPARAAGPAATLRQAGRRLAAGEMIYGLFRRDALERCGPYPLVVLPDRLILLRLSLEGPFRLVPRRLWYRRYRAGVTMSNRRQRQASFPDGVPLRARIPWWLSHGPMLGRSAGSPRLGAVVLAGSIEQAVRRSCERARRRRRWRRREQRRRLRAPLGRAGSARRTPAEEPVPARRPSLQVDDLRRGELLDDLERPGAVVLEVGSAAGDLTGRLAERFPDALCLAADRPERFPDRIDLALSVGGLERLSQGEAEALVRTLHERGTRTLVSVDRQSPGLRRALDRWFWLHEPWVEGRRAGRRPDPLRVLVETEPDAVRHVVGRRRLIP